MEPIDNTDNLHEFISQYEKTSTMSQAQTQNRI